MGLGMHKFLVGAFEKGLLLKTGTFDLATKASQSLDGTPIFPKQSKTGGHKLELARQLLPLRR